MALATHPRHQARSRSQVSTVVMGRTFAVYLVTALGMAVTGLGFLLGPAEWGASPSYAVIRSMAPMMAWGIALVVVGVMKVVLWLYGERLGLEKSNALRIGSMIGAIISLMWAGGFLAALFIGELAGWSALPSWAMIAGVQLVGASASWSK